MRSVDRSTKKLRKWCNYHIHCLKWPSSVVIQGYYKTYVLDHCGYHSLLRMGYMFDLNKGQTIRGIVFFQTNQHGIIFKIIIYIYCAYSKTAAWHACGGSVVIDCQAWSLPPAWASSLFYVFWLLCLTKGQPEAPSEFPVPAPPPPRVGSSGGGGDKPKDKLSNFDPTGPARATQAVKKLDKSSKCIAW